jgi:hypothetical protein
MPTTSEEVSGFLGCLALLAVASLLIVVFVMPRRNAPEKDLRATRAARNTMSEYFNQQFPDAEIRVEQRAGSNLEVWIAQRSLDSLIYPDRKAFLDMAGKNWCNAVSIWTMPTLTIRDTGNGKKLAIYHCLFSYSAMSPGSN